MNRADPPADHLVALRAAGAIQPGRSTAARHPRLLAPLAALLLGTSGWPALGADTAQAAKAASASASQPAAGEAATRATTPASASVVKANPPDATVQRTRKAADSIARDGPVPTATDAAAPLKTITVPAPARLLYDVTARLRGGKYNANAELHWRHDGKKYDARLEIRALSLVLRSQASSGEIGPRGLAPTRFVDKTRNERRAYIDREHGRITFSADTPDVELESGVQDRLSVIVQLSSLFATDPGAFVPGTSIDFQTVGPTDVDDWQFTVKGEETVSFAGAQVRAVKLERDTSGDSDQRVEVWFAPLLGYLPVRLKITQANGDFVDQRLSAMDKP